MIKIPINRITREIKKRRAKKVLIQAPEGIKPRLSKILPLIEAKTGTELILHAESCFGACDLASIDAKRLGATPIIHVGHTSFDNGQEEDIVFIDAYDEVELGETLQSEILRVTAGKVVGLAASIQYLPLLHKLKEDLEERGRKVLMGFPSSKNLLPGQILGCDVSTVKAVAPEVDEFLVVSGGVFHGLGVALWTGKKTWRIDPYRDELIDFSLLTKKKLAIIAAKIDEARRAEDFGVIIGIKEGQKRMDQFQHVACDLRKMGKQVVELAMGEISPEKVRSYDWIECFVQTLCPRISIDDIEKFGVPVLSYEQFLILKDEREFSKVYHC